MATTNVILSYSQLHDFEKIYDVASRGRTSFCVKLERMISVYNNFAGPNGQSMNAETVNSRMHVAGNGKGTAEYDSRKALVEFLKKKKRRQGVLNYDAHQKQKFFVNFLLKL